MTFESEFQENYADMRHRRTVAITPVNARQIVERYKQAEATRKAEGKSARPLPWFIANLMQQAVEAK